MRADRLVAILLLLQRRGQVTAAEVAEELEVSERTARRDFEALGAAGIPVYAQPGRNGGWRLAGGGTTDLSGLTAAETRALFLVAGPAAATPTVRAALRKLVRALPSSLQDAAEAASSAVVVDPAGWGRSAPVVPTPPLLDAVQQAVVEARQIRLGYEDRQRAVTIRVVEPLGMASKGPHWYLIADTDSGMRTFRVDRISSVVETGRTSKRPEDFDLARTWAEVAERINERRAPVVARALIDPGYVGIIRGLLGTRVSIGPPVDGRIELELRGHSIASLGGELAGLAPALTVLRPPELRAELHRIGRSLVANYGDENDETGKALIPVGGRSRSVANPGRGRNTLGV